MEQWKEINATEFCYHITDGTHDSPKAVPEGKFLITSKHIKNDQIDFDSAYKISEEDYFKIVSRSKVDKWDIIISMIGAYCGFCYLQDNNQTDFAIKNVGLFKVGEEYKCKWLYYYLTSPQVKQQLAMMRSGSSQPYIALNSLRNLKIPCPSKEIMVAVVSILDSIDKKIRLNRQINDNLEQQAQALFKSWFVDFEPFKDSEFVDSELGMIPKGWRVFPIKEIAKFSQGTQVPIENQYDTCGNNMIRFIRIVDYTSNNTEPPRYIISDNNQTYCSADDIVMVRYGNIGKIGRRLSGVIANNLFKILPIKFITSNFLYYFFNQDVIQKFIIASAAGSAMPAIKHSTFGNIYIAIPPQSIIESFDKLCSSVEEIILKNLKENDSLISLRDTLLPRLMSGELKINEINY